MITNTQSIQNNPIYTKDITTRSTFLISEIEAAKFISNKCHSKIYTDAYYGEVYLDSLMGERYLKSSLNFTSPKNFKKDGLIIIRAYIINNLFHMRTNFLEGWGKIRLNYNPSTFLEKNIIRNKIYDNTSVFSYSQIK